MLWRISFNYATIVDAPASLAEARNLIIEKIKADPGAVISRIEPAEPSCKTLGEVFKKAVGF